MCGRYASTLPPELMARTLSALIGATNMEPNWNLAPTQGGRVLRRNAAGQRQLDVMQWGLVPVWTKALKAAHPFNARAETVATSITFRGAYKNRRCLVPADLFYEWRAMPDGKQPYAIARADSDPLVFGGLWESWRTPDNDVLRTYTIVTTPANAEMATLHDRMPLVLEREQWPGWLGEVEGDPGGMLRPAPDGTLWMWPVSRAVNSVRNNGPELTDRIDDPAAPPPSDAPPGANPA
jgi:putative SOS response-associated peptidase YedK